MRILISNIDFRIGTFMSVMDPITRSHTINVTKNIYPPQFYYTFYMFRNVNISVFLVISDTVIVYSNRHMI